jgi:hypothetical protein
VKITRWTTPDVWSIDVNPSEVNNLVSVVIMFGAPIVGRWGLPADQWGNIVHQIAGIAPDIAMGGWMIYSHWNMKKVPETASVYTKPTA